MKSSSDKGRASRDKGARGEVELAHILRDTYGYDVHRGYVQHGQSDLVGLTGIHPEVKRVEKLNLEKAMEQAITEAYKREDGIPTVFHRKNRGGWMVTMMLDDWIDLYGAWAND